MAAGNGKDFFVPVSGHFTSGDFLKDYEFTLPEELIARFPVKERGTGRLLVADCKKQTIEDRSVLDLPDYFQNGDVFVLNNTRVSRRRVFLRRKTGARIEAVFLKETADGFWECLIRGSARLRDGEALIAPDGSDIQFEYQSAVLENTAGGGLLRAVSAGQYQWKNSGDAESFFEKFGEIPLPPYLKRPPEKIDDDRYQTVFSKRPASAAAPTAGLHLTADLLEKIKAAGAILCEIELCIGYGTFAPLSDENFISGKLHAEEFSVSDSAAETLRSAKRRIAAGTTSLRAMESNYRFSGGKFQSGNFETTLFLYPPETSLSADRLLTNFHLPASSLFLLVCAFGGREFLLECYSHAVKNKYRFFSYGDAMLLI